MTELNPTPTLDNPKITRAWAFYDWANSSYALVILSTIFPIYYSGITAGTQVTLFGQMYEPKAVFGYSLTLSFLILVLLSPILSAMADTRGNKLSFLKFFCTMGSVACMSMFFITDASRIVLCLLLSMIANIGFYGSLDFYNAYLPEIASKDQQDALSARGFSLGYTGSLIILCICLGLIMGVANDENRGFYTRLCFLITGLWWLGFAQYSFRYLPRGVAQAASGLSLFNSIAASFKGIAHAGHTLFKTPNLNIFLGAFFFYSVGMQTIFVIATFIGDEIGLDDGKLILTILCLQVEAIVGALLLSRLSKKIGNRAVLILAVVFWIVACVAIYFLNKNNPNVQLQFYAIAGLVGLVMGGLQSMSRSTYSKLLPPTDEPTTFFSFYDVLEKTSIIVGTFTYSTIVAQTGAVKPAALAMAVFFCIGLLFLFRLKNQVAPK